MSANCACHGSDFEASLWVADYMKNEILLAGDKIKKNFRFAQIFCMGEVRQKLIRA
jgi:hypothetical protein